MHTPASAFYSLLLITGLAVMVPILSSRLRMIRLPLVVGEIIAGIVIGKSGFQLVQKTPTLDFLAEFGFVFLMFLSGLEVSFGALGHSLRDGKNRLRAGGPVPLALLNFALTLALATVAGFGLKQLGMTRSAVLMGLILSTTSLGIVVPILKERSLNTTPFGQLILISALVSDFATLLLLSLVIGVINRGFSVDILLFLVLLAAFLAAARLGQWAKRIPGLIRMIDELSHATSQLRVRGAFALMVILVVLAQALGVELILGAFLAGAITSIIGGEDKSPLREKLDAIGYGFFIPIFFISVGANFDMGALISSPRALLLVPILIGAGYLVKLLPALVFVPANGWRKSFATGVLLSSRLSLIIAASAIALDLEIIAPATNSAVILLAIVTCTGSPILFNKILPARAGTAERGGVVILGTDQLALLLGQRLKQAREEVVFIGRDQERLRHLSTIGLRSVLGDASDEEVLEKAGLATARALIAVTGSTELNIAVCRIAREKFNLPVIIARADDPATIAEMTKLNVKVVQPAMAVALAFEGALHFPSAFGMMLNQNDVSMVDIRLRNAEFAGRPLRRIKMPGDALVVGVHRDGEVMVPRGGTVLELQDILVLVGNPEALREARRQLDPTGA